MIVVSKDGSQRKMNINYIDYMLGFTRESQLKKLLKEGVDPSTALATANGRPPKKAGKKPNPATANNDTSNTKDNTTANTRNDTINTKDDNPKADAANGIAGEDNAAPLDSADDDTSPFTAAQDEQIMKFKADNPQGKWEDLAKEMGMEGKGKDLQERFKELKKWGRVAEMAKAGGGEKVKREKKEDKKEGGNGCGGDKKGKRGKDAANGGGIGGGEGKKGDKAAAMKNFSEAEMTILRSELVQDDELKSLRIASALFNLTGRGVHPDDVKAALGF